MKIETKYDVGQTVWWERGWNNNKDFSIGKIEEGKIREIVIKEYGIEYRIEDKDDYPCLVTVPETILSESIEKVRLAMLTSQKNFLEKHLKDVKRDLAELEKEENEK